MPIYGGYVPMPGRWHSGVKLGGVQTPPIEFVIDPSLPSLGQDQLYPNRDFIVIPRGRIVASQANDLTRLAGETVITLANGVDPLNAPTFATGNVPFGYAPFHIYRSFAGLPADRPLGVLQETIEVPYTIVNEAYNTTGNGGTRLKTGEWLMPYYGSAVAKTGTNNDRGKLVRWVEKKVYQETASAVATFPLTNAPFPAFLPRVLVAWNGAGVLVTSGATSYNYNETTHKWEAVFSGPVATVIYEYGANATQRIGQCIGIEPVGLAGGINSTSHDMTGWLKWVTDNFGAWDWPPILDVRPTNQVTNEVVTIDANNTGTIAHTPLVPFKAITVAITGSITAADGTTANISGNLNLSDTMFFQDYSQGQYYDIDFLTGAIRFASNVSVAVCTVSYYYESGFKDGVKYDAGILGLTDGRDSGVVGLPTHLDVAGVRGALRVMITP